MRCAFGAQTAKLVPGTPSIVAQLRAEFFVNFPLVALAEQKQIRFAQRGQK